MSGIFCTGFSGYASEFVTALSPFSDGAVTCSATQRVSSILPGPIPSGRRAL
jgi:hypothetical protein